MATAASEPIVGHATECGHLGAALALQSHELLQSIWDSAPAGLAMLDTSFRFVRVNPRLAELNGIPAAAHIGRTPRELFPALPVDDLEKHWRRILQTGEPLLGYELCGETPADPGRTRWWREDWYPVRCNGRVVGIAVVAVEVTQEKRAAELQRLLLGIVGHDLRNPLAVIITSVRMLLDADRDHRLTQHLKRMDRAARRIVTLARDLLDYTKVSAGGDIPVEVREADLARIVDAAVEEARLAHPDAVIEVSGDQELRGRWDHARLQQVVGNLLSNAAKYGTRGGKITVRCWHAGDDAVLEVHNEGPPIPPERTPFLFDGLSQFADAHARQGGIGLGLFICREIVRAHGGTITVSSDAVDGTTFRVVLPVCRSVASPDDPGPARDAAPSLA